MREENYKQVELNKMKLRAAALFWFVSILFVLAAIFERQYAWLSFVRATAEAAMVGAIADWFAVTALFRHPLNLKIPHTAIIPRRKDAIGQEFGTFVQHNFLSEEVIADKLQSLDIAQSGARWISQPENSQQLANHAAVGLTAMIQVMKDEDVQDLIERGVVTQIRSIRVAPLLATLLTLVTAGNRHQELLYGTLKLVVHLLEENKQAIRTKISRETPWWVPRRVDDAIYQRIIKTVKETLHDVNSDPHHPLHAKFNEVVSHFVEDLKHSPDIIARENALKEELLQHPAVREFSFSLWIDIKTSLLEPGSNPDSDFRRPIQHGITKFGEALLNDKVLLEKINRWVEDVVRYIIKEYGHEVGYLISQTIRNWDTEATSRKVELYIGKDLQFIRINGTLVGGLAGLMIHLVFLLLA